MYRWSLYTYSQLIDKKLIQLKIIDSPQTGEFVKDAARRNVKEIDREMASRN